MNTIPWAYALLAVFVVSLVSFIGVLTLSLSMERLRKWLLGLVTFAAGAMIGDAFIHLVPEVFEGTQKLIVPSVMILVGVVLFFLVEKVMFWRHCHIPTSKEHVHSVGMLSLIGDAVHNFLDGAIIAGSFLVSPYIGVTTTVAVILHEIPQEIGDFGILIYAGYTRSKALFFNFLSALTAILGALAILLIGESVAQATQFVIPITIGGFLYIALSDLLPQVHEERIAGRSIAQFVLFVLGIGVMALLLLVD